MAQAYGIKTKVGELENQLIPFFKVYPSLNEADKIAMLTAILVSVFSQQVNVTSVPELSNQLTDAIGQRVSELTTLSNGTLNQSLDYYAPRIQKWLNVSNKYDTSTDMTNLEKETRKLMTSITRTQRQEIFSNYNESVINASTQNKVMWHARLNTDAECMQHNREIMTIDHYYELYPIHPNCMCTIQQLS